MPFKHKEDRLAWWRKRVNKQRAERRALVAKLKDVPCKDCGGRFPPECMDFDHVRGKKQFNIALCVSSGMSDTRLQTEIAKCEIVCANCHRIRTRCKKSDR